MFPRVTNCAWPEFAEVRVWDAMQTAQGVAFVTDDAVLTLERHTI